jgi:hypothetical protein
MGNPFIIAEVLALIPYLNGIIVSDEKSNSRQVKVWFGYPDVEVRTQEFPFITIDLIDITPANNRQHSGYYVDTDKSGTVTSATGVSYQYDIPIAYDLTYQVTSYARHPRHDRAIMYQLWNKFPSKYGALPVPNQIGTETANRSMFLDGFAKKDAVTGETGNRRLLRNVYTVRVVSEMSPSYAAASGMVNTVHITDTTTYIPSGLTPVQSSVITQQNN